ncbi:Retrovirus-related Pol polyprotein, partial [Mucuna pruriens]
MEEEAKPIRKQQRRMNLTILDVVKKEVTKLLAAWIIYPILDSQWVIPVQVVPKKSRMTVMKNQHDELVPMQIQNSWRVCIDCRRLNQATRKDHFPFPFIDQVLEKLVGKSHYCFLDGFSGYMQIHIAPEDYPTRVVSAVHTLRPSKPNKEGPNCIDHISYPARRPPQRQLSCHVTPRKSAMS